MNKRNGKRSRRKSNKLFGSKGIVLVLALMLVVGGVVGGTLAWLTAKTDTVTNTFTTSDIDIKLKETERIYKMIPGYTIEKDPKVTVLKDSEKCYLFVKVEKSENFNDFLTCEMADGWDQLKNGSTDVDGVYYRVVEAANTDQLFSVLKNDQVTVKDTVTKTMMDGLDTDTQPTLTFTAYAIQYNTGNSTAEGASNTWDTPYAAWQEASKQDSANNE